MYQENIVTVSLRSVSAVLSDIKFKLQTSTHTQQQQTVRVIPLPEFQLLFRNRKVEMESDLINKINKGVIASVRGVVSDFISPQNPLSIIIIERFNNLGVYTPRVPRRAENCEGKNFQYNPLEEWKTAGIFEFPTARTGNVRAAVILLKPPPPASCNFEL